MEELNELISRFVGSNYVKQSEDAIRRRGKLIRILIESKRLPVTGWDSVTIEWFLQQVALMDSNNFLGNVGAGEREGRVYSDIIQRRHFHMAHGIGRSGDIAAIQPKAAGSSLISKLATEMIRDLFHRILQMVNLKGFLLLPLATGMSLSFVLSGLRISEKKPDAKYVIWHRIDQATCLKAIVQAGFLPIVLENELVGDVVKSNTAHLEAKIAELGSENIISVISTTSCFCPRIPDDVESISVVCKTFQIAHVINNAYGLQCSKICHKINEACKIGRVDAVVQSLDKNFMVPVGGAIVAGPSREWIENSLSHCYPGRASIAPIMDLFVTLLSMGSDGYVHLRKDRIALVQDFERRLQQVADTFGERVLATSKWNTISFAITLSSFTGTDLTKIGSMLFTRGVSGARVVAPCTQKTVAGVDFASYGASTSLYPVPYMTISCSIGITAAEVDTLFQRLQHTLQDRRKQTSI